MHFVKVPVALVAALYFCCACNSSNNTLYLQSKIDSLQHEIGQSYKPGLGEFMSSIQTHHAKLWYAGTSGNWRLADFEIHEIMESVADIKAFAAERPESKDVVSILPELDSLNSAIEKKDARLFRTNFISLTNACNNCHRAVDYGFNIVTIPSAPPVTNQQFMLPDSLK